MSVNFIDYIKRRIHSLKRKNGSCIDISKNGHEISESIPSCIYKAPVDLLKLSSANKFNSIVGILPYAFDASVSEKQFFLSERGFSMNTPLYVLMLDKCIDCLTPGGELIIVCSSRFASAVCAGKLNTKMFNKGTITDWIDLGDKRFFKDSKSDDVLLRYEFGDFSQKTQTLHGEKISTLNNGVIRFQGLGEKKARLGDFFTFHLGAVSGCNKVFYDARHGNVDIVCAETIKTGKTSRVLFNSTKDDSYLISKKEFLLRDNEKSRKNELNWWKWQSSNFLNIGQRIYLCKMTRGDLPFFLHDCNFYDGSLLALMPKNSLSSLVEVKDFLNDQNWTSLGFDHSGKKLFTIHALEETMLDLELENLIRKYSV